MSRKVIKVSNIIEVRREDMIRLLELRKEKEMSQREVAKRLFVSQGTYNNWENEKTQPSIEQLILLSKLFDVSIDYIVGNSEDIEIKLPNKRSSNEVNLEILSNIQENLDKLKQNMKN